jgi:MGT family glycosyltransferase
VDFPLKPDGTDKLIYISMGTINNRLTDFYNLCIEAFRKENAQVVISVGSKTDPSIFGQVPEHFVIRKYIPQLEVLKHADVILCHGGLNSVSEALYYGVPVIAVPLANDQPMVAHRLTELGAGLELKMEEVTAELLKKSVHKVLSNQSYKDSCDKIRDSFIQAGGCKNAADIILNYRKKL